MTLPTHTYTHPYTHYSQNLCVYIYMREYIWKITFIIYTALKPIKKVNLSLCMVNFYSSCPLSISSWILIGKSLYFISLSLFKCQIQNLALNKHSIILNGKYIQFHWAFFLSIFLFFFLSFFPISLKVISEPRIPHSQQAHPLETGCVIPTMHPPWACPGLQTWDVTVCNRALYPIRALVKSDRKERVGQLGF